MSITCTLTGAALRAEAVRLAIPGRSRMSADQLRAAIAAATEATTPPPVDTLTDLDTWAASAATRALSDRNATQLPDQRPPAPGPAPYTPRDFVARWGKRKPSRTRVHRRRSI